MGFKIKRPSPPSVKSAVKAVKKAVPPSPAASAAKSLRQAGSSASQKTSQLARGAKRIAKTTGGKVGALAADGTRIRYGTEISRIGSRNRITRTNSRNTTTTRIIRPGAYTVRYRGGTRPNLPKTPIKRPPMPPGMVLKSMQATQSLIDRSGKSIDAVKNVSKAAKKAGDKVGALAAKGTKIPSGAEIRRIGSRQQRRRINTRNRIIAGKLRPGSYVVRDRALPSLPKSSSGPKLLDKAKKTFSNPGKAISKAAKSPKKSLAKKIKAARKAKIKFPKSVKGPKATCPLKGLKLPMKNVVTSKTPAFKSPQLKLPRIKVKAGALIGGAIGMAVGGPVGAMVGAAVGAGLGSGLEVPKPPSRISVQNRRAPEYAAKWRAGKTQPGDKNQRHAASTSASVYPGQQNFFNCGVQSCAQIIAQATGVLPNERQLLELAIENGWAEYNGECKKQSIDPRDIRREDGGTISDGRKKILEARGVPSKAYVFTDSKESYRADVQLPVSTYRDVLGHAIWGGKGIIASIHTSGAKWWEGVQNHGHHALCVVDGDFDKNGNLTHVYITDTGVGVPDVSLSPPLPRPGPLKVPIDDFMKAVDARVSFDGVRGMEITDNRIWP